MLKQMKENYQAELTAILPLHKQLEQQEKDLFLIAEKEDTQEAFEKYDKVWSQYHKVDDIVYSLEKLIDQLEYTIELQENLQEYKKMLDK